MIKLDFDFINNYFYLLRVRVLHENMVLEVIFPQISFITIVTGEGSEVLFHSWRSQRLLVLELGRSTHRYHSGHDTL